MKLAFVEVQPRHPVYKKELQAGPFSILVKRYTAKLGVQAWFEWSKPLETKQQINEVKFYQLGPEYIVCEPTVADILVNSISSNLEKEVEIVGFGISTMKKSGEVLMALAERVTKATKSTWNGKSPRIFLNSTSVMDVVKRHEQQVASQESK